MKLVITINMDNAAFEDAGSEAARILRELAFELESCAELSNGTNVSLHDANGNKVGMAEVKGRRP